MSVSMTISMILTLMYWHCLCMRQNLVFGFFFHHSCEFFLIMTCTSVIDTQGLINPSYLGHHFDFVSFNNSRSLSEICPIIRPIYLPMSKYITSYHKKHSPTKHITMMLGEIKTIKAMLTLLAPQNRKYIRNWLIISLTCYILTWLYSPITV